MNKNNKKKYNLPPVVYVAYDQIDGEVFCAYIDKDQCERDAKDSGCGVQTVMVVNN